ncbi:MAG: ComEC/Rec2 family competence protein, partial [Candidatus Moranbacteria bacterium]|nr:ComEC/Rec2 family competence protein [Candidatus Moranbacteria bacterium]
MNLNKSKIFLILSLSFLSGIFCRSFYEPDVFWIWIFATAGIAVFVSNHKNIKAVVFSLAAVFFLAGIWRTDSALEKTQNIPDFDGEIADTAYIIKEPEDKEWYKNVVVKTKDDRKILVRAGLFEELNYGDEINLSCDPEIPQNFSQDFDYRMYLAKDGIFYVCQKAEIEKTGKRMNNIYSFVLELKKKMEKNVDRAIPAPQSALAKGLLFGGDEGLSKDLQESFSKTGMTHIVAVSGYNVTIIAEYLMLSGIFLGMWRKQAFYFALFGIFLFVAMIGFPSSAIRAGLMGSLLLWAMKNGRLANIDNAILLAGAIMLWINPLSLRWDIGFQLSFLATFGIVKMAPLWGRYFFWKNKPLGIVDIGLMTIIA